MRGRRAEQVILKKMIKYCDEIAQMLERHNSSREDFENNSEFQFAAGMCIIQLGERISRLDDNFIERYSEIPWRQINNMSNICVHDYENVDNNAVWVTITEDVPELKEKLQAILNADYKEEN
ncbi:MAG: DUF86 domain-containing protein [Prevotella sp.]|nr:DUF86 domain-containing protein [Prevotella sp.]